MIPRADFDTEDSDLGAASTTQFFKDLPIRTLEDPFFLALLRKPDFQRETNHWSAEQLVTLIESYVDNQLIPALILWKSPAFIFVIDGGHRLSALRAWITDDYGDGPISQAFYGGDIPDTQKQIAKSTRKLVERRVGRYSALRATAGSLTAQPNEIRRAGYLVARSLDVQWVQGNADVAEKSFFNINSQGTPLDDLESMLIVNRKKALAIASRAVVRSGSGHKYWSQFDETRQEQIQQYASEFHSLLFEPEMETPIRTLDLPLGGSVSPVPALGLLIDFFSIASSSSGVPRAIYDEHIDEDGSGTLNVFSLTREVLRRIVGNDGASLGLNPAVYFYNERGVYSRPQFLGTLRLITEKVRKRDFDFFRAFTRARRRMEPFLIENKAIISLVFAKVSRGMRVTRFRDLLENLVAHLQGDEEYLIQDALAAIGIAGQILDLGTTPPKEVSRGTKTEVFFKEALASAQLCPICQGLLYPKKSVHFDHIVRQREDGKGTVDNIQMTHPFCNAVIKN